MIRRSVAGVILGVSLLLGSFAWSGFLALRTVFDADRSRIVAQELLDNEEVRAQLTENLTFAMGAIIPAEVPVSDEVVAGVTDDVLNDPEVEALILDAFASTHAAFLGDGTAPEFIDLSAAAASARASLIAASPQLDAVIPASPTLSVPLPTERIPNVKPISSFLEKAVPVLAVLAIGGALLALFTTSDRPSILRRAGFWALTTTAFFLVVGLGIPWLLREYAPEQAEVLAALMTALLRSTLVPSITLGVVGGGLLAVSAMWPAGGSGRTKAATPRTARTANAAEAPQPTRNVRAPGQPQQPRPGGRTRQQRSPRPQQVPRRQQQPTPASGVYRPPIPQQVAPPYPDAQPHTAPTAPQGAPSPYPDPGAGRLPHTTVPPTPSAGTPPTEPPQSPQAQPPAPAAGSAATHSVFADVAPPSSPDAPQPSRSVFDEPATPPQRAQPPGPVDADPFAAFKPRWVEGHGWLIHPDDPRPTPAEAVWIEGVGHVVPRTR